MLLHVIGHRIRAVDDVGIRCGPVRFTAPIDDLLGLRRGRAEQGHYRRYLEGRYGPVAVQRIEGLGAANAARAVEVAARAAVDKRVAMPPLLVHALAEVRVSLSDEPAVLPDDDIVAIAAFTLLLTSFAARDYRIVTCPKCGAPWVAPVDASDYCLRPAPGGLTRSCRVVNNEERLQTRDTYVRYRREYKRITEAVRRGSISREDARLWREKNTEHAWRPYDDWKGQTRPLRMSEEAVDE